MVATGRQHEGVPGNQAHRVGNTVDDEPAVTGNDRITFDELVLVAELDSPIAASVEAG